MTQPGDDAKLVLTYDSHNPRKDRRGRWVLPSYCAGLLAAAVVYGFVGVLIGVLLPRETMYNSWTFSFMIAIGGSLVMCLPAALALGICIWLRQAIVKEVRFARARYGLLAGFIAGCYPLAVLRYLVPDDQNGWWFLGGLGWHLVVAIVAGFFLCYRSHLRD